MATQHASSIDRPFSSFWLACWSLGLALGWLLPNHYAPWIAFHFDAWIAGGLAIAAVVVVFQLRSQLHVHRLALVCALAIFIPVFQFWFGLLPYSGQAWLGAAFLIGLMVAMLLGAYWESVNPCQAIDGLFLAIGAAGIVSVGLELYQWLGLSIDALDLWIMGTPDTRTFANFVQPNQLGTFLLWALLACAWGVARGQIGPRVAVFMAIYLLSGVALTQSRTALLAIVALVGMAYFWRRLWHGRQVVWTVAGLAAYYFICVLTLPLLGSAINVSEDLGMAARSGYGLRLDGLWMFLNAAINAPVFGYGWAQTVVAQIAVAENHTRVGGVFMQAHNLFLDLVLWCGIPLGLLLTGTLILWFVDKTRKVSGARDAILVLFVGVVGWHAMLELPLHYAYMLLPAGLVMGVLNFRLAEPVVAHWHRWQFAGVVFVAVALLAVIVRDYLRIEQNFYVLRFERARIGSKPVEPASSVLILNHMNEFVRLGRTPARKNMTAQELNWMRSTTFAFPALSNVFNLATALAWNERTEEAQKLVHKLQGIATPPQYEHMRGVWREQARADAAMAAVSWPM